MNAGTSGTPKAYRGPDNRPVKHLWYDSFGNRYQDTRPELYMPIGFAGGLLGKDTGLVRFGYRDYDPFTGRFTGPDPLGDTGGDHDLYDYCVAVARAHAASGAKPSRTINRGKKDNIPLRGPGQSPGSFAGVLPNEPAPEQFGYEIVVSRQGSPAYANLAALVALHFTRAEHFSVYTI